MASPTSSPSSSTSLSAADASGDTTASGDSAAGDPAAASSESAGGRGAGARPYTPPQVERLGTVAERTGMPASPSGLSMPDAPSK